MRVPEAGRYTLSLWWPDSDVAVRSKWARAMSATVVSASGARSEPTTLDLTSQGGDQWVVAAGGEGEGVQLEPGDTLEVACPTGGGDCIADGERRAVERRQRGVQRDAAAHGLHRAK